MFANMQLWSMVRPYALVAFLASACLAIVLVLTKRWHGRLSMDGQEGVQRFHTQPTPRVGGVAIFFGAVVGFVAMPRPFWGDLMGPLLLAGIPAFGFGLLEDLTKRVSVRTRLLATMACGVLGWYITGYSITDANMPGLDWLLSFSAISVAFTAFAVGGVANAINIIDGFNGLACGSVIIMFTGLGLIASSVGDGALASVCLMLGLSVLGLLLVNWPWGKIFLGDGGAYFLGFSLAWVAVLLLARNPQVSAWAPLLVCGYPVLEVAFSILRRRRRGASPGDPDRLHLHSLVKRRFVRRLLPDTSNLVRNSVTGAAMWLAALLPVSIATIWPQDSVTLAIGLLVCAVVYSILYIRLTQFGWHLHRA